MRRHPHHHIIEDERAMETVDSDLHNLAIVHSQALGVGRIHVKVPLREHNAVIERKLACRTDERNTRRVRKLSRNPYRCIEPQGHLIGARNLDLIFLARRTYDPHMRNRAFRTKQCHGLLGRIFPGLRQPFVPVQRMVRSKQLRDALLRQMHVSRRDRHGNRLVYDRIHDALRNELRVSPFPYGAAPVLWRPYVITAADCGAQIMLAP